MTIAAISTAIGEAGIGIVRISGDSAIGIAQKIFKGSKFNKFENTHNRKLIYGHIIDEEVIIDEVLIAFMKGPYTYTREDMVEIYCHGGIISVRKVLEAVLKNGGRMAEPGEFTKRAFLNGRLDLSQAEAVMDLIKAKTDKSFQASLNQLEGSLSKKIIEIRDILLNMIAQVEVSIDFPDEDYELITYEELKADGNKVKDEIENLIRSSSRGKILRDGLNTLILGKPNVGKSSLLNAILKENRAIVTDIPGTTRDVIEEFVNIDGIPLKIIDTAGIRETEDLVEKIGVDRAKDLVDSSDLIIAVFDVSRNLSEEDFNILDLIKDKKSIIILNKTDLQAKFNKEELYEYVDEKNVIEASIISNVGVSILEDNIRDMFYDGEFNLDSDVVVTNIRHKNMLDLSLENIERALLDMEANVPIDCVEVDLRNCWENLGEISGDTIGEDILDKIFRDFCLGK